MNQDRQFATTQWSVVLAAGKQDGDAGRAALAALCERYWYPLYAYIRRRGSNAEDAQDLTQAFFAFLLEKNTLEVADERRGRFRSFLLASLNRFAANQWRSAKAHKRGGHLRQLSLDFNVGESRISLEPADGLTPEKIFDRRWALTLLDATLMQIGQEYSTAGNVELFEMLRPLLTPAAEAPPYQEIAARLSMSEGAVKVAVHRLRRRYGEILRELVAETVASPAEVDDELHQLMSALGG